MREGLRGGRGGGWEGGGPLWFLAIFQIGNLPSLNLPSLNLPSLNFTLSLILPYLNVLSLKFPSPNLSLLITPSHKPT